MEIIKTTINQTFILIIIPVIMSYLLTFLNKFIWKQTTRYSTILKYSLYVGVPIHELSHMVMCIIFGHKIESFKLIDENHNTGTLGYVNHRYNKRNIYHIIGSYFIAFGPLYIGSLIILLLGYLITPNTIRYFYIDLNRINILSDLSYIPNYLNLVIDNYKNLLFSVAIEFDVLKILNWLIVLILMSIAINLDLSKQDLRNSTKGIVVLVIFLLVANLFLSTISYNVYIEFNSLLIKFSYIQNIIIPVIILIDIIVIIFNTTFIGVKILILKIIK